MLPIYLYFYDWYKLCSDTPSSPAPPSKSLKTYNKIPRFHVMKTEYLGEQLKLFINNAWLYFYIIPV